MTPREIIQAAQQGAFVQWQPSGIIERLFVSNDRIWAQSLITGQTHLIRVRPVYNCRVIRRDTPVSIGEALRVGHGSGFGMALRVKGAGHKRAASCSSRQADAEMAVAIGHFVQVASQS